MQTPHTAGKTSPATDVSETTDDLPPAVDVTLPQLDAGLTVLDGTGRAMGPLQSLVLDHVLLADGDALWVDARGNAATSTLARVRLADESLDRYDEGFYADLLVRAAESVLLPFDWDRARIRRYLAERQDAAITMY